MSDQWDEKAMYECEDAIRAPDDAEPRHAGRHSGKDE